MIVKSAYIYKLFCAVWKAINVWKIIQICKLLLEVCHFEIIDKCLALLPSHLQDIYSANVDFC